MKNSSPEDPYVILGLKPGASFEEIQRAKQHKLAETGENPIQKAKVEAAYDSLLMVSLKERQLGKVSNAAVSASKREDINKSENGGVSSLLLTRFKKLNLIGDKSSGQGFLPGLNLPIGEGLTIRIAISLLLLVLLLVSPDESIQLILSFSVIGLFVSQIRRGRKFLPSLLWSFSLLSIGLIIGGLLVSGNIENISNIHSFSSTKLESMPAFVLILLGSLFLE
tara:strand:+ start:1847 stop:2515 length:669 start_codon:yes stop_codon:yes gene_type:complete